MELEINHIGSEYGTIEYYSYMRSNQSPVNLYIHGLGYHKNWFNNHFARFELDRYSWIVPDLMGHGNSSKPETQQAYTMDKQAEYLADILKREKVNRIRVIAHSMGGAIAISLLELLSRSSSKGIEPILLLYLEGNLDEGDAFFSSKVAEVPFEEYKKSFKPWCEKVLQTTEDYSMRSWVEALRDAGSFTVWASSRNLVKVSKESDLFKRLRDVFGGPTYFVFGERNKGIYSSEELVKKNNMPVLYVSNAGHAMHEDNPSGFWKIVLQQIESTSSS
ncbi:alpha/beta hydrolase [Candidatus Thorarchaeota archaeon]|nr:MAG: alpha/beta hydrolase [Candidatus Thorarchaeota archaeon]